MNNRKLYSFIVSALFIVALLPACNKLSKQTAVTPTSDSVIAKSNVLVVDTNSYHLVSTEDQLASGTYVFLYQPSLAAIRHNGDFQPGTIIIGVTGQGYLRKIISVDAQSESITLNTVQATLEDVFEQGEFAFETGFATYGNEQGQYRASFSNRNIYSSDLVSLSVRNADISINADWQYGLRFRGGKLVDFRAQSTGGTLKSAFDVNITASGVAQPGLNDTISHSSHTIFRKVGNIPLLISTDLYLVAEASAEATGIADNTFTVAETSALSMSTVYNAGSGWANTFSVVPSSSVSGKIAPGGKYNKSGFNIVPRMVVRFYGAVASVVSFPMKTMLTDNHAQANNDWDFMGKYSFEPTVSQRSAVLGTSFNDYNETRIADSAKYFTPYQLVKVSGDNQHATIGLYLAQPLVVKVTDSKGTPQAGVPVYFNVTAGSGNLSYNVILSDASGLAKGYWQIGSYTAGSQTVEVTAHNADGSNVPGAPVTFSAN